VLTRIERHAVLNAFMPIEPEAVLAAASASEKRWRAGAPLGRIDGVPASIKDNIWPRLSHAPWVKDDRHNACAGRFAGSRAPARTRRGDPRQDHHARTWLDRRLP